MTTPTLYIWRMDLVSCATIGVSPQKSRLLAQIIRWRWGFCYARWAFGIEKIRFWYVVIAFWGICI